MTDVNAPMPVTPRGSVTVCSILVRIGCGSTGMPTGILGDDPEVPELARELRRDLAELLCRQPRADGVQHGRCDFLCLRDGHAEVRAELVEEELIAAEPLRRLVPMDHAAFEERLDHLR